ncbi:protein kinase [Streptomyces sp. NPDC047072]|uniref:serine/threonine-protein kinase n=1 Tax=Streptomyces sp. NPDC047072 TaxID=3154809 RepID=UPI0033E15584
MRGELLAGRFLIGDRLGVGGMGEVWAAQDERMRRDVAVKLVHAFGANEEETRTRFRREVQLAGRLSHQNIVTVHDWGEVPVGGRPVFYLVMELVQGVSLGRRLKEGAPAWPLAVGWAVQIAQALDAAHRRGVVHRDIKPANVLLTPEGTAKVLDFGVAKFLGETMSVHELTVTGALLGSPPYMSPEQADGAREIDHRSDLYSLGCLLYHALTGRPPFVGDNPLAVLRKQLDETPVPPGRLVEDLPDTLNGLVLGLLAKSPDDRPVDADAVQQALIEVLVEESMGADGDTVLEASRLEHAGSVAGRFLRTARELLQLAEAQRAQAGHALAAALRAASLEGEQAARDIDVIRGAARTEAERIREAAAREGRALLDEARLEAVRIRHEARREALAFAEGVKQDTAGLRAATADESVEATDAARAPATMYADRQARSPGWITGEGPERGSDTTRPEKSKTKKALTYLGLIEDDGDLDDDVQPEPEPVSAPKNELSRRPAAGSTANSGSSPFWMAVPMARQLFPEDGGIEPIGELLPGTWYLAVESRGSALVVQTQDGRRGILQDTVGIQRG